MSADYYEGKIKALEDEVAALKEVIKTLSMAATKLADEADAFQCDEGNEDGMRLADAIGEVYKLTGI